jgi:polysaccharide deacetylase family protein (PEP-CTERM system associated)
MDSQNILTIDVEDWFHILDCPGAPRLEQWSDMTPRAHKGMERLLVMLAERNTRATFFWLGWMAERFPELVRECMEAGHEIGSHGYGHVLAYKVGRKGFQEDIQKGKQALEDLIGQPVSGFRAPGFGITGKSPWAFDVIKEVGYEYDSSVFPARRGHGGMEQSPIGPYFIYTKYGILPEIPMSVIDILGRRLSLFGGGYFRLAPRHIIRWGINKLREMNQPLVVYVHPREVDPHHPRLPLSHLRKFKSYVNLKTTMPKLNWLCTTYSFCTMGELAERCIKSFYFNNDDIFPVFKLEVDSIDNTITFLRMTSKQ